MDTNGNTRRDFLKAVGLGAAHVAALSSAGMATKGSPVVNTNKNKSTTPPVNEYALKTRTVKLDDRWDVVVVGGGPSGCTAAAAAAREGARTLLIETTSILGGMGTAGLVPAWCPFSDGIRIIYSGLAKKVFFEAKKGVPHEPAKRLDWVTINAEQLKRVYDELVTSAGVKVLFHSTIVGVEMNSKGVVDTVLCANKAGLTAYRAKVYVDCTGDGDVAAWAGAAFEKSDQRQPATHCFVLSNVSTFDYVHGLSMDGNNPQSPIHNILRSGKYPLIRDNHMCTNLVGPDTVGFNAGHLWNVDRTDPDNISKAMMDGRKLAEQFRQGLAEFHPKAFGAAFLAATAPLMGVRESRRIVGDYMLTIKDYRARQSFPDEIARNCYFLDVHPSEDELEKLKKLPKSSLLERYEYYKPGESHGIPYRCLTPKGLRNVLVAGRCISADHIVQGSIRVMPVCLVTGEAAGVASALAMRYFGSDVHAVDTNRLRSRLREVGAYLP